jgi:C1A family cysteine protease
VGARPTRLSGQTLYRHRRAAEETADKNGFAPWLFTGRRPGQLGSCTANALVGNPEFLEKKAGHKVTNLSRLFVYYNERAMEGTINYDAGAMIRDGVKSLVKLGVCSEKKWP